MNEELKIIIKAVTSQAKKAVGEVREELERVQKEGDKSGKSIKTAMQSVAKYTAIAVTAIAAVTTALVALGKNSLEVQRNFSKLNAAFESAGSSASQAAKTYEDLYRFMGDSDSATEAAQMLALITNNEKDLAEWTKILQGVYAEMGQALPIESLAEAANETIKTGKVVGTMADALNWAGVSEDAFNEKLAKTTSLAEREALVRSTLNSLYMNSANIYERNNQALLNYNESQARADAALAEMGKALLPLMTSLNNLAVTLLTVLKPAFEIISGVIAVFVDYIVIAVQWVSGFFSLFSKGGNAAKSASKDIAAVGNSFNPLLGGMGAYNNSLDDGINKVKELKKQAMGFDELNVVSSQETTTTTTTTPGGGGGGIDLSGLTNFTGFSEFAEDLDETKEKIKGIIVLAGIAAGAFLAWQIANFIAELKAAPEAIKAINFVVAKYGDDAFEKAFGKSAQMTLDDVAQAHQRLIDKIKLWGGILLIAAGAVLLIQGYSDAWVNGIDWGNFAAIIGGVAAIIGGIMLAFGPAPALFAAVGAGVLLIITGLKDLIENGASVQNVIMLIMGALLLIIPIIIAFNTALLANPIMLVVVAAAALVAGLGALAIALFNQEPAIKSVEDAQNAYTEAINNTIAAENNYINAVDAAEASMKRLQEVEKQYGISGEELYAQMQEGTLTYATMTEAQKEVYKAYVDNEQKQRDLIASTEAFEKAKKDEIIASKENQLALAKESGDYDSFKKSVVEAFESGQLSAEEARDLIEKSMSEMSDASQQTFMKDLPNDIKDGMDPHNYESAGTKMKKWFSRTWAEAKEIFNDVGEFFAAVGDRISNAIGMAIKGAINGIITIIENTINVAIGLINGAINLINKLPGVNVSKIGKLQLPRITNEIPKLAKGGIVDGATLAMIGEQGKEAVVPLENNTEWMDRLADRIAARNGTPSKIVLNLDGKELGWASIHSINDIARQTGTLPLEMV